MKKKTLSILLIIFVLITGLFTACGTEDAENNANGLLPTDENGLLPTDEDEEHVITLYNAVVPLADFSAPKPAVSTVLMPVASGTEVRKNQKAQVDISNKQDGYIMIRYTGRGGARTMTIITGPSGVQYVYYLRNDGEWEVFPLSDGNGSYTAAVFRNISGNQYSTEFTTSFNVTLKDKFAPFLRPNQYVNFSPNTIAVKEAATMVQGVTGTHEKIKIIYNFVVAEFSYDKALAQSVQSGYLPDLDKVWNARKGICFDFAALTTAMLRSQGIPTKLVVGYVGQVYHAWINVWVEDEGWVTATIFFDGDSWNLMDPTFAAGASSPERLARYIGDGSRYAAKFLY